MEKKKMRIISVLFWVFVVIGIIFPVGFLLGIVEARVAFPIMFICMGCQHLLNGINWDTKSKALKIFYILFGIFFLLFAIFEVIPSYYFK